MRIHIVVCLAEYSVCGQRRRIAQNAGSFFVECLVVGGGGGGTRRCAEGEEGAFVREGTGPSLCCAKSGRDVGGRRVAEYEEFDECSEEDYDGELAKEEALCEGEAGGVRIAVTEGEYTYEDSIFGASAAIFVL